MRLTSGFLEHTSPAGVLVICLVLTALVGAGDYAVGPELSTSIFYVAPIALAAWYGNWLAGVMVSVLSAITGFIAGGVSGAGYSPGWVPVWNTLVRLGLFLIIASLIAAFRRTAENTARLAFVDALTHLANRRAFAEQAEEELERSRRYGHPFTVAYIDIDNFKQVNDAMGHTIGDDVLKLVAAIMKENCRATDYVARLGGDEFVILLAETAERASEEPIKKLLLRLREATQDRGWALTFSVGMLTFMQPPASVRDMVKLADDLMYMVKKSGKNGWRHDTWGGGP